MKTKITSIICAAFISGISSAQMVSETVSIGAGQINQNWYSLENGSQGTALADEWDISFGATGIGSSIHINSENGVELWVYPNGAIGDWASVDTSGLSTWSTIYDSDTSWSYGAFDMTADLNDGFDLGWGVYDMITHQVQGDSIHIIKLTDGNFKKVRIDNLASGTYNFTYADLDGNNEVSASISKSDYTDKQFGYYSIVNDAELDREPAVLSDWDLLFTKHIAFLPMAYPIASILTNPNLMVAKETGITDPQAYTDHHSATFGTHKNTIGGDWKSWNGSSYDISDDVVYFVKNQDGDVWKIVPTGFGGSANGNFEFDKEKLATASLGDENNPVLNFSFYPNPNNGETLTLIYESVQNEKFETEIYAPTGQLVSSFTTMPQSGFEQKKIDLSALNTGIYLVKVTANGFTTTKKLIINK